MDGGLVDAHTEEASKRAAIAAYERDAYRNNTSSVSTAFNALFLHPVRRIIGEVIAADRVAAGF